jgi:hypothetical protein
MLAIMVVVLLPIRKHESKVECHERPIKHHLIFLEPESTAKGRHCKPDSN